VRSGAPRSLIRCELAVGARRVEISVDLQPGNRDKVLMNGQRVDSSRDLLRVLRTTLFTPDDLAIVKEGPSGRRDLLDEAIEAASPRLAADRQDLERVLRHRNALLRQLAIRTDEDGLAACGERVAGAREDLVSRLQPLADHAFAALAPSAGSLQLRYARSFDGELAKAIAAARNDDLRRQVTTVGPQRDDLEIEAGGLDSRSRLSQGRQRATALALRLATHRYVTEVTGATPVLLLDDAFSELDEETARALMAELPAGQALLTTAGSLPPGATAEAVLELREGRLL
jgi:DNA replication and repair protein RecF